VTEFDLIKIDTLKSKIKEDEEDLKDMAAKNRDLMKNNDDLKEQVKSFKQEMVECNKLNESQEKVVLEQNEKISNLMEKQEDLVEKLILKNKELEELQEKEKESLNNRTVIEPDGLKLLNILDDECKKLKETTELDDLKREVDEKSNLIVKLKESVQKYENQIKDTEEKLEKMEFLTNENKDLKVDLRKQVENNKSIQALLNEMKSQEGVIDITNDISSETVTDLDGVKLNEQRTIKKRGRPPGPAKDKLRLPSSVTLTKTGPSGSPIVDNSTFNLLSNLQNGSIDLDIVIE